MFAIFDLIFDVGGVAEGMKYSFPGLSLSILGENSGAYSAKNL